MLDKLKMENLGNNQVAIKDCNKHVVAFYSYGVFIIELKNGEVKKVSKSYDYSKTTVKFLNQFLYNYCNEAENKKELEVIIKNKKIKLS